MEISLHELKADVAVIKAAVLQSAGAAPGLKAPAEGVVRYTLAACSSEDVPDPEHGSTQQNGVLMV
jgi:hypothetical protein